MKKMFNILCSIILVLSLASISFTSNFSYAATSFAASSTAENSSQNELSSEDWKIIVDDKKSSDEFGFIQRNLASSDLSDDGHFLLISGIILIVLAILGIIYFSFRLYRISKKPSISQKKHHGNRYK